MSSPDTYLPSWGQEELPEPPPLSWRNWTGFIGPGIVMMGIQIGGGEWLFGPIITAQYGGGLMWIATIAIILQVFYNIECGRYALYCGEPVMTGFMRVSPGPRFWVSLIMLMSLSAFIPGLSSQSAVVIASLIRNRPPTPMPPKLDEEKLAKLSVETKADRTQTEQQAREDKSLVTMLSFACMIAVILPVLMGGKVYNMLQVVMTGKVVIVLSFCLIMGLLFVHWTHWIEVFSGFLKFGVVPVLHEGKEVPLNVLKYRWDFGEWPTVSFTNIATIGAFAGYAGGGGMANSTYSNYVRDKGWGMGRLVGAIPSAVGGRHITLSHVGKVFPITTGNLRRWSGWWRYIMLDQLIVWGPGCFMGMALPALLSLQFADHSPVYAHVVAKEQDQPQAVLTADGIRHSPQFSPEAAGESGASAKPSSLAEGLWTLALLVGLAVFLPSQMSVVEDFSRRWTDTIWSSNQHVRKTMKSHQVKYIYYSILTLFVLATLLVWILFTWLDSHGSPQNLMVSVIANFNNLAIGITSLMILRINRNLLPPQLQPRWYHQAGIFCCGVFYIGLFFLVIIAKFGPVAQKWFS
ncbi:MAG: Nramp family divalent metal transporter [Planctomycetales bacterium]|nr:Nramp family divalent metal transporter [Planctomycetales bacterium]